MKGVLNMTSCVFCEAVNGFFTMLGDFLSNPIGFLIFFLVFIHVVSYGPVIFKVWSVCKPSKCHNCYKVDCPCRRP